MEENILTCTSCFSTDIVETKEGYVCRTCGIIWTDNNEFVDAKKP